MLRSQPYTTALGKRSLGKRAYKSPIETSCSNRTLGGNCGGVPPLPIPNREVKPTSADGTAMQCGRVGNRLLLEESSETKVLELSFFLLYGLLRGDAAGAAGCGAAQRGSTDYSWG